MQTDDKLDKGMVVAWNGAHSIMPAPLCARLHRYFLPQLVIFYFFAFFFFCPFGGEWETNSNENKLPGMSGLDNTRLLAKMW